MAIDLTQPPPPALLRKYHCAISGEPPFTAWCRLKQSVHRELRGWACGTDGHADRVTGKPRLLGNFLTDTDADAGRNFLDARVADAARRRVRERETGNAINSKRLFSPICFPASRSASASSCRRRWIWRVRRGSGRRSIRRKWRRSSK